MQSGLIPETQHSDFASSASQLNYCIISYKLKPFSVRYAPLTPLTPNSANEEPPISHQVTFAETPRAMSDTVVTAYSTPSKVMLHATEATAIGTEPLTGFLCPFVMLERPELGTDLLGIASEGQD